MKIDGVDVAIVPNYKVGGGDRSILAHIQNTKFLDNPKLTDMAAYAVDIIRVAKCLDGYMYVSFMDTGNSGMVCEVTFTNNDGLLETQVVKLQLDSNEFPYEVYMTRRFSELGIGVKMYQHCYVNLGTQIGFLIGVIALQKVNTLDNIIDGNQLTLGQVKHVAGQIKHLLIMMKQNNISHNDLHLGNIGYVMDNQGNYKLILFDFGRSCQLGITDLNILSLAWSLTEIKDETSNCTQLWNELFPFLQQSLNKPYFRKDICQKELLRRIQPLLGKLFAKLPELMRDIPPRVIDWGVRVPPIPIFPNFRVPTQTSTQSNFLVNMLVNMTNEENPHKRTRSVDVKREDDKTKRHKDKMNCIVQ
jgi:hypothetical protein